MEFLQKISLKESKLFHYSVIAIFALSIFFTFSFIIFPKNIYGDGKIHSLNAIRSIGEGRLVSHQPHLIYSFADDKTIYVPISYPLMSESVFSVFYLIDQEIGLKFFSPFIAVCIFLILYNCLVDLGFFVAVIISTVSVLAISERLIMAPLIEPFLVLILLTTLFLFKKYLESNKNRYLYLSAVFISFAIISKQQGLFAFITLIFFLGIFLVFRILRKRETLNNALKIFFIFTVITVLISAPALVDQFKRNGTLAFAPGSTNLPDFFPLKNMIQPLLRSKFPANSEALEARNSRIGYDIEGRSFFETLSGFSLSPFLFFRSDNKSFMTEGYKSLLFISLIIILLWLLEQILENKLIPFWILVVCFLLEEITISYIFRTPIQQYQSFGIVLLTVLLFTSFFRVSLKERLTSKIVSVVIIFIFVFQYSRFMYPLWSSQGREDDYHEQAYKKLGIFVKQNIEQDSIFLAAETMFRFYADRDSLWINENIGDRVEKVLVSSIPKESLAYLKDLNVDFVVVDKSQLDRRGVYDYLPSEGLVTVVKDQKYFSKIYDPYNNGDLVLYKINYQNL